MNGVELDLFVAEVNTAVAESSNVLLKDMEHVIYKIRAKRRRGAFGSVKVIMAMHISMFIVHREANAVLINIGKAFGGRDHSTIIHSCNKIDGEIDVYASTRRIINGALFRLGFDQLKRKTKWKLE